MIVINSVSSLWCIDRVREPLCEPNRNMNVCNNKYVGAQGEVYRQLKIFLTPTVVYAINRSKAVVPVLFLFCVALWFILRCASCFKVFPCSLTSCFFISFSIVIASLVEEGAGLCASRTIVCLFLHVLVSVIFLFLLVSGVGCGWLMYVIVALPGLFY